MVTTDNYLVLAGKDAHQNETLVKRCLRNNRVIQCVFVFARSCPWSVERPVSLSFYEPNEVDNNNTKISNNYSTTTTVIKNKNKRHRHRHRHCRLFHCPYRNNQALREAGQFTTCHASSAWRGVLIRLYDMTAGSLLIGPSNPKFCFCAIPTQRIVSKSSILYAT